MKLNIIRCLAFIIGLHVTTIALCCEDGHDRGYHSDTERHNSHVIKKNLTRTTPRRNLTNKKKRLSLGLLKDDNSTTNFIISSPTLKKRSSTQTKTNVNNQNEYQIAVNYVLGERKGKQDQFIALRFLSKLPKDKNIDEKTESELQNKIKKFNINFNNSKIKAYYNSWNSHSEAAAKTCNEMERIRELEIAKKKILKAEKYIKKQMKLLNLKYEDSDKFQEISTIKKQLKNEINNIPAYNNSQAALEDAKRKEAKAHQHLKLAAQAKENRMDTVHHSTKKKKSKMVTAGLLQKLRLSKNKLETIQANNARGRSVNMHLTEGMRKGNETTEQAKAQELFLGSVKDLLESYDHNPKKDTLEKASKMIETAGDIEEEITRIGPSSETRKKEIQKLKKKISEKKTSENDTSSSSEIVSDKENI